VRCWFDASVVCCEMFSVYSEQYYAGKKGRIYDLKTLEVDEQEALSARDNQQAEEDYELFLQELDADKEMRATVNLYKHKGGKSGGGGRDGDDASDVAVGEAAYDDDEDVRLDELLDGMTLRADPGVGESAVLTAEEAARVPAVPLEEETAGFNAATFDPKDYKFT
jgi:hypothetical protein